MTFFLVFVVGVVAIAALNRANALKSNFDDLRDSLWKLQRGLTEVERQLQLLRGQEPEHPQTAKEAEEITARVKVLSGALPSARQIATASEPAPACVPSSSTRSTVML